MQSQPLLLFAVIPLASFSAKKSPSSWAIYIVRSFITKSMCAKYVVAVDWPLSLAATACQVMGRLSDAGTTVLCSVERRGDDGVPRFLEACEAEGFSLQMVYRAAPSAPAPVELYEFCKGGGEGFRGVPVAESDSGIEVAAKEEAVGECVGGGKAGLVGDGDDGAAVVGCSGGDDAGGGGVGAVREEGVSESAAR